MRRAALLPGAPNDLTCRALVELVTAYLEGAMARAARARLEDHLAACPGCRAYLRQMGDTLRAAGRLSEGSIPRGARDALLRAFRAWRGTSPHPTARDGRRLDGGG